jgi:hypothetical protein
MGSVLVVEILVVVGGSGRGAVSLQSGVCFLPSFPTKDKLSVCTHNPFSPHPHQFPRRGKFESFALKLLATAEELPHNKNIDNNH